MKKRISKHCNHCGKQHFILPSDPKHGKGKYCSKNCRYEANGLKLRKGKTVLCCICGKSVYMPKYRLTTGNTYCSTTCQHKGLMSGTSMQCEVCENTFYIEKNKIGERRYCSMKCRNVGNSGSNSSSATHLMSKTRIYNAWTMMKDRCYNPNNKRYKDWGGRGIEVCDRWRYSFENFFSDMGHRPEGKTLDRIDNNGNYEPDNCRWATYAEQNMNKRNT